MPDPARRPTLTPDEAKELHYEALVIDSQQPAATNGFLFTDNMRAAMADYARHGLSRGQAKTLMQAMAAREIMTSAKAREAYLDLWDRSGVNVASSTYGHPGPIQHAFERSVKGMAEARAIIDALDGDLMLVLDAGDIERAYRENKRGIIFDFQDTIPLESDLDRLEVFYNLGLRVVQLTYNLRNLAGDGCTETHKSGLTYFGRDLVHRLNAMNMVVDVSHCSEQVGWDALEESSAPIMVTHSSSAAVCYHDRAKSDELAKAIADKGGFFGVVVISGFLQETTEATLDDFANHVEHLVDIMGIDHVGIGSDKAGPGPGTESLIEYPEEMGPYDTSFLYKSKDDPSYTRSLAGDFNWSGFRKEHRLSDEHHVVGYEDFGDWPKLTMKLAERGFIEAELRKLLGLNYLRVFRDVVG